MRQRKLSTSWRNIFKTPDVSYLIHLRGVFYVFLFLFVFFLPGRVIKINQVECESQYGECPEDLNFKLQALNSNQITNSKKQIQNILKNDLMVSDYSIQYAFPDKLKVSILLKKAKFAILNKDTQKYLLLGNAGEVLGTSDETLLPYVIQNGETPNLFALTLMEGVFNMHQVNRGEIKGASLVVELPTRVRVIFPLEGSAEILLGSLRLIYSQVTDKEIDLRFKNPILR